MCQVNDLIWFEGNVNNLTANGGALRRMAISVYLIGHLRRDAVLFPVDFDRCRLFYSLLRPPPKHLLQYYTPDSSLLSLFTLPGTSPPTLVLSGMGISPLMTIKGLQLPPQDRRPSRFIFQAINGALGPLLRHRHHDRASISFLFRKKFTGCLFRDQLVLWFMTDH